MKKLALAFTLLTASLPALSCTDFQLKGSDGTILISRSMEFALDLQSNLRSSPRGRSFTTTSPDGKPAMAWKATYGYLYVDGLNQDYAVDGMNEQGLAFEYLYLPGLTQYQTVPPGKNNQSLPYLHLGDWILSSFKTVDEVRTALQDKFIFAQTNAALNNAVFPLHAAIHDASGKGIVVEFVNGNMRIHDFMGIMTNSPTYDWQTTNLRNYVNLSPYDPHPIVANGIAYAATGQGAGAFGLPGDISPPSRFVKMSFLTKNSYPVNNAADLLNLGQHIINNVDIPAGISRALENGKESAETTQWVVFKDLTHKIFYYRTYNDMTLRAVNLDKINFTDKAPTLKMPLVAPPFVMNMTAAFSNAK